MQTRKNAGGEGHLLLLMAVVIGIILAIDTIPTLIAGGTLRWEYIILDALLLAWWHSWFKDEQRKALAERLRIEYVKREAIRNSARGSQHYILRERENMDRCA